MNKLLLILGLLCMSCSTRPIEMEHCQTKCAASGGLRTVVGGCNGVQVTDCFCSDGTVIKYIEPENR